jgi:hypothetical protein
VLIEGSLAIGSCGDATFKAGHYSFRVDILTGLVRLQSIDLPYPGGSGPTPAGIDQDGMNPFQDAFTLCRVFS